jgi:hypothetical protein
MYWKAPHSSILFSFSCTVALFDWQALPRWKEFALYSDISWPFIVSDWAFFSGCLQQGFKYVCLSAQVDAFSTVFLWFFLFFQVWNSVSREVRLVLLLHGALSRDEQVTSFLLVLDLAPSWLLGYSKTLENPDRSFLGILLLLLPLLLDLHTGLCSC